MKINVKQLISIPTILAAIALILAIVSVSIYGSNISSGYYYGLDNATVTVGSVFAIILSIAYIALAIFDFGDGIVGKIMSIVRSACIVGVCICLAAAGIAYIGDRAEGLAYIYFSDANLLAEIQTPGNLASAQGAIAGTITYLVGWLFALVASFFKIGNERHSKAVENA